MCENQHRAGKSLDILVRGGGGGVIPSMARCTRRLRPLISCIYEQLKCTTAVHACYWFCRPKRFELILLIIIFFRFRQTKEMSKGRQENDGE